MVSLDTRVQTLQAKWEAAGQGHVFAFWETLSSSEQAQLLSQLEGIDVDRVNRVYYKATGGPNGDEPPRSPIVKDDAALAPLPDHVFDSVLSAGDKVDEWRSVGLQAIAENKVAVILMAGGQGTRLGSSDPKGCYDIHLPSGKTLFQLQAERILRLQSLAQEVAQAGTEVVIPWYIMTSGPTNHATVSFFEKNDFFGLNKKNIMFFEQGTLPCLTYDGKILMETKFKVAIAPDGNGGIYSALQQKGVIASLKERGIEYSHCYCVDNCLAKVADPIFIGCCVSKNTDCGVKTVAKARPEEAVGVVCLRNGKYNVVEYSEISREISERRKPDGTLAFGAGNIANHFYTTAFLERVPEFEDQLEYHIARKKIKHVNTQTGEMVAPKIPNGIKLELFVFDVFPFAQQLSVLDVDRKEEFSPLKNAPGSGVDCPETSRQDIMSQHVRFVEKAGGKVLPPSDDAEIEFEISPLVSYAGEGLEVLKGKTIQAPCVITTPQDLLQYA